MREFGWMVSVALLLMPTVVGAVENIQPRSFAGRTELRGQTVTAWLPAELAPALAARLQTTISEAGAKFRLAEPNEDLVDSLHRGPILAVGHAGNNPAVRRLYFEYFDWTDLAWPSRGGHALRTIVDPYATGNDVLRIAYSDSDDAEAAVSAFCEVAAHAKGALPYLCQVKLGELAPVYARYLDPLLAPSFAWEHEDCHWDLQVQIAHLGLGYLFTGREEFLSAFRTRLLAFLKHHSASGWVGTHGFMHHLTVPYFLTEHHSAWSRDERRTAVRYFLEEFRSGEGIGGGFSHVCSQNFTHGNHEIRRTLDIFLNARYFDRYYKLPDAAKGLKMAKSFFQFKLTCAKPLEDGFGHQFKASIIDTAAYALATGDRTMIESGTLRRAADRAVLQVNNQGWGAIFSDIGASGIAPVTLMAMASVAYDDSRYLRPIRLLAGLDGDQPGVPAAIMAVPFRHGDELLRAFAIGPSEPTVAKAKTAVPEATIGVAGFDDAYRRIRPEIPKAGFDKLALRNGFHARSEYLLLDGIGIRNKDYEDTNCVVEMGVEGYTWLSAVHLGKRDASVRNQNGFQILHDGLPASGRPLFAELLGQASHGDLSAVATLLDDPLGKCPWRRWIVHRRGHWMAVFDDISVSKRPTKELALVQGQWFLHGRSRAAGRTFVSRQGRPGDEAWLTGTVLGDVKVAAEKIDFADEYRCWGENCNAWLHQFEIKVRPDHPIDPAASPSVATKVTLSHETTGDQAGRVLCGWFVTWGRGKEVIPQVVSEGSGRYTIRPKDGETFSVAFDAQGMQVAAGASRLRLDLPPAQQVQEPFFLPIAASVERATRSGSSEPIRPTEIACEELPLGHPVVLRELDGAWIVSTDAGQIAAVEPDGHVRWKRSNSATITRCAALHVGKETLVLLGDESGAVTAIARDGSVRWQKVMPFSETVWLYHTLGRSKIRALAVADVDNDGREEIAVGVSDMHLYLLDDQGKIRWKHRCFYGTPGALRIAKLDTGKPSSILYGFKDPVFVPALHACDAKGQQFITWGGRGDYGTGSVETILPVHFRGAARILLGFDADLAQIRCLDLGGHEQWRLNAGARLLGLWQCEPGAGAEVAEPTYLAAFSSGYLFELGGDGKVLARCFLGQSLRGAERYADGRLLLLGNQLFVVRRNGIGQAKVVDLPARGEYLASEGPTPAVACFGEGRARVFVIP
jgi:hypothetical protein